VTETQTDGHRRAPSRAKRPRSAITSGRELFVGGNSTSAWSRRFHDLLLGHIHDCSAGQGPNALSDAQLCLIRRAASIECELERLDALLSCGKEIDMDAYARISGHLRRMWETLGLERKQKNVNAMDAYLARKRKQDATSGPLGRALIEDFQRQQIEDSERDRIRREEFEQKQAARAASAPADMNVEIDE
jgi:hypothetical protein